MLEAIKSSDLLLSAACIDDHIETVSWVNYFKAVTNMTVQANNPIALAHGDGYYVHLHPASGRIAHPVFNAGVIVGLLIDTEEDPHEWHQLFIERVPRLLTCYQCGNQALWLAPDSRCRVCTHLTPEEIRG